MIFGPTACPRIVGSIGLPAIRNPMTRTRPADLRFQSRGGYDFRFLAKNRYWDEDFWIDWVGPRLDANLDVETWRRGKRPGTEDCDGDHCVEDTLYVNLESLG